MKFHILGVPTLHCRCHKNLICLLYYWSYNDTNAQVGGHEKVCFVLRIVLSACTLYTPTPERIYMEVTSTASELATPTSTPSKTVFHKTSTLTPTPTRVEATVVRVIDGDMIEKSYASGRSN